MKYLMLIALLLLTNALCAQQTINVDDPNNRSQVNLMGINGEPVTMSKYVRITEGSIFIPAEFTNSTILIRNNKRPINNVKAKINVVEHSLHYLDERGNEMMTRMPIEEIFFVDATTGQSQIFSQFPDSCISKQGWYEIMEKGPLTLYREIIKTVTENKPYGSATTEQKVNTTYKYQMRAGTVCKQVVKINDFINELTLLNPAFGKTVAGQKFTDKKSEDWITIARIFNSTK
jgi:hypothetical protein